MKRTEMAKWYRKASQSEFQRRLEEMYLEKAKLMGSPEKLTGGLKQDAMKLRNLRREIAMLRTIAQEREIRLG